MIVKSKYKVLGLEIKYSRFLTAVFKTFYKYMEYDTNLCLKNKEMPTYLIFTNRKIDNFLEKIKFTILKDIEKSAINSATEFQLDFIKKSKEKLIKKNKILLNSWEIFSQNKPVVFQDIHLLRNSTMVFESVEFFKQNQLKKIKQILEQNMEKRKIALDTFRNSFLFNTTEKEKLFRLKYPEPKYRFTKSMSVSAINNLNRDITAACATMLGSRKFVWRTCKDEKVRPSHRALENKIFLYDDMPSEYNDPGCRCRQDAII